MAAKHLEQQLYKVMPFKSGSSLNEVTNDNLLKWEAIDIYFHWHLWLLNDNGLPQCQSMLYKRCLLTDIISVYTLITT